tara:strand:- start:21 stop:209 length:189 start_codon:yes stop_codon:yes gene_type:complete
MLSKIKIHCTDNDKWLDAEIVNHTDSWMIVVTKPGDLKINLKKTKPGVYVGTVSGYEFVYQT